MTSQHSFSHVFCIRREEEITRFRHKLYPRSEKYIPESGLKLIKENSRLPPIAVAHFWFFDAQSRRFCYQKNVESLIEDDFKLNCLRSSKNVSDRLEKLPIRRKHFIKMNLEELHQQIHPKFMNLWKVQKKKLLWLELKCIQRG